MAKPEGLTIHAENDWPRNGVAIYLRRPGSMYAAPLVFEKKTEDELAFQGAIEPAIRMRFEEAQELVDELWRCGIRPIEAAGSVGALSAVGRHLEDMRRLVFDVLKERL